jgi:cytolysin-activating lysine-acyltransferase
MNGPGHDAGGATAPPDGQVGAQDDSQDNIQTNAQDAPQPGGQTAQITPDLSAILGQAAWVMMQSRAHRHLFVGDMEWLLLPPIAHRQFRLWRRNNMPVAYASWALLSDEVEARLMESLGIKADIQPDGTAATEAEVTSLPTFAAPYLRLAPGDWQSGDNLWLIDLVCPFGGTGEAAQQLRVQTFKSRAVKTVRQSTDGAGFEVGKWGG